MTESPTVSAGDWFTVAEPLTVYADDDRNRRIGSLPESGRYKVIAVDDGFVGVPGPEGATGWIRWSELEAVADVEKQAQPETRSNRPADRAPDLDAVDRKDPADAAAPSSGRRYARIAAGSSIALVVAAASVVFTRPSTRHRSHWLQVPNTETVPIGGLGERFWVFGTVACICAAAVAALGVLSANLRRRVAGATLAGVFATAAVVLWVRLADALDWASVEWWIELTSSFKVAALLVVAAAAAALASVAFAFGRTPGGAFFALSVALVVGLGAQYPLARWAETEYSVDFRMCDGSDPTERFDAVLFIDHHVLRRGSTDTASALSTIREVRPGTEVVVLDWNPCGDGFEPAPGTGDLSFARSYGEVTRPGDLSLFIDGELVRTRGSLDLDPDRFARWLAD